MRMKRTVTRLTAPVVGLATALTLVAGCATTNISSSWVTPGARPVTFDNTLVVFMHAEETTRRAAEEYLVARIGSDRAVASYTVISQNEVRNTDRAKVTVRNAGFDGVVVLRVIGVEEHVNLEGVAMPPSYELRAGVLGVLRGRMAQRVRARPPAERHDRQCRDQGLLGHRRPAAVGGHQRDVQSLGSRRRRQRRRRRGQRRAASCRPAGQLTTPGRDDRGRRVCSMPVPRVQEREVDDADEGELILVET